MTDKEYSDGSRFDDRLSTRIEYIGKVPVLVSEYKEKNFRWPCCKSLSEDNKRFLAQKWSVDISFCPKCGEKLIEE
ncbi:hypothetical protein M2146_002520 [Lachnospiraceae bacterium PF1-22]